MRDPFVDGGSGGIIIGADCCVCGASVCVSPVSSANLRLIYRNVLSSTVNATVENVPLIILTIFLKTCIELVQILQV